MNANYLNQNELNIKSVRKIRSHSDRSIGALNLSVRNVSKESKKSLISSTVDNMENSPSPPNYYDLNRIVIESTRKRSQLIEEETHKLHIQALRKHSDAVDGMVAVLSALYCKILVVIGL